MYKHGEAGIRAANPGKEAYIARKKNPSVIWILSDQSTSYRNAILQSNFFGLRDRCPGRSTMWTPATTQADRKWLHCTNARQNYYEMSCCYKWYERGLDSFSMACIFAPNSRFS